MTANQGHSGMRLLPLRDLGPDGTREIWREDQDLHLIVMQRDGRVLAFYNECPHQGRPLNFARDRFLYTDEGLLMCPHHGAVFRPDDGACVDGPCRGAALKPFPVRVEDGWVLAAEDFPAEPPAASGSGD